MGEIMTGNNPLFYAFFGPEIAKKRAFLRHFGTIPGLGWVPGPFGISRFAGVRKLFRMRGLQVVSDKSHYVN